MPTAAAENYICDSQEYESQRVRVTSITVKHWNVNIFHCSVPLSSFSLSTERVYESSDEDPLFTEPFDIINRILKLFPICAMALALLLL